MRPGEAKGSLGKEPPFAIVNIIEVDLWAITTFPRSHGLRGNAVLPLRGHVLCKFLTDLIPSSHTPRRNSDRTLRVHSRTATYRYPKDQISRNISTIYLD